MTAIGYEVRLTHRHAHLFDLRLTIAKPQALQTLSLPVWIPGSYLVRDFAKHLQQLTGEQGGRAWHLHDGRTVYPARACQWCPGPTRLATLPPVAKKKRKRVIKGKQQA